MRPSRRAKSLVYIALGLLLLIPVIAYVIMLIQFSRNP